jgi:hypothetical protein
MDRRLLFPAVAISAFAQQADPAAVAAEKALRARVDRFFQLQVDKKFREAESLVAEESKDDYYNDRKYTIKGFTIDKIELLDNNTRARVTIRANATLMMPGVGPMDFNGPAVSYWKVENGEWSYYIDREARLQTPFGRLRDPQPSDARPALPDLPGKAPDIATLRSLVKIDRNAVPLTIGGATETVAVSNEFPGPVDLDIVFDKVPGLSVELEKKHLETGEKTSIRLRAAGPGKGDGMVHLQVSPTAAELDIRLTIN